MAEGGQPPAIHLHVAELHLNELNANNVKVRNMIQQNVEQSNITRSEIHHLTQVAGAVPEAQEENQDVLVEHDGPSNSATNESKTDSGERKLKEEDQLARQAEQLRQRIKFGEEADVLEALLNLTKSNKLYMSLEIVECEIRLSSDKVDESIRRVAESIPESVTADDLLKIAGQFKKNRHYVRALILFRIANELNSKLQLSPDDVARWIGRVGKDIAETVASAFRSVRDQKIRNIANEYGTVYMKSLLQDLQALEDVGDDVRAANEARCYTNICFACFESGEHESSVRFGEEGLARLEEKFANNMIKFKNYGKLLHNISVSCCQLHRYSDARHYAARAVKATKKANYENQAEKQEDIDRSEMVLSAANRRPVRTFDSLSDLFLPFVGGGGF